MAVIEKILQLNIVVDIAVQASQDGLSQVLEKRGVPVIQSGYWAGFGGYTYYDTQEDLGLILETYDLEKE